MIEWIFLSYMTITYRQIPYNKEIVRLSIGFHDVSHSALNELLVNMYFIKLGGVETEGWRLTNSTEK